MSPDMQPVRRDIMRDQDRNAFHEITLRYLPQFCSDHEYEKTLVTDAVNHDLNAAGCST